MIKEQFKKNPILWIFIGLCIIGFSYFRWIRSLPQDYTVGRVIQIYKPFKGGTRAEYSYYVNGKEEQESLALGEYRKYVKEGMRFLVEYPEDHPHEGYMLFDYPVPDGVEAPPEGWDEKPKFKHK